MVVSGAGPADRWSDGDAYEAYIGRWSRRVARAFLPWIDAGEHLRWLDVGAGTGALSATIVAVADPLVVVGVDPSAGFVADARRRVDDPRVRFEQGDACTPAYGAPFDVVVSGLVLNFMPDVATAVRCMTRAVARGGLVAAYVWDYAGGMEPIRRFWDAAAEVDADARRVDEAVRFPLCDPDRLAAHWRSAGLRSVKTTAIDVPAVFRDFDDYWAPFLGGQGPAPTYLASLSPSHRAAVRRAARSSAQVADDGSIPMVARAWAVQGRRHGTVT